MSSGKIFSNVSVLIPCYCASSTLLRAINSVLSQTSLPREIILIDDASPATEGTAELIGKLVVAIASSNPSILVKTVFLSENLGPGGARNAGWKLVTQPWIAFLDSDDSWHDMKLEIQMDWVSRHPHASIIGHKVGYSLGSNKNQQQDAISCREVSLIEMLISNQLPTRSVIIRSDLPYRFAEWRFAEDYYLWLSVIASGHKAYKMNALLAFFYRPEHSHGGQSGDLWSHEKCEIRTFTSLLSQEKIGKFIFLIAVILSLLKYLKRKLGRVLSFNFGTKAD